MLQPASSGRSSLVTPARTPVTSALIGSGQAARAGELLACRASWCTCEDNEDVQPALTAAIAVLGTLLGATISYFFQRRQAGHVGEIAARGKLREERIAAYSAFAQSVADLRGGQLQRWTVRRESDPDSEHYAQARSDSWRLRTAARSAMYRVQLVADDEGLAKQARELVEVTIDILDAGDSADLAARAQRSSDGTDAFIAEARRGLKM